jgi:hypothetical protein
MQVMAEHEFNLTEVSFTHGHNLAITEEQTSQEQSSALSHHVYEEHIRP